MKKIIFGDSLSEISKLDNNSIDLIVCDLPYFKIVKESWDNQWKSLNDYLDFIEQNIIIYKRVLKDTGNIFLFTGRQYNNKISSILDKYFVENRIIIWSRKRGFNNTRGKALASGYEPICFYSKTQNNTFNTIKIKDEKNKRKEYTEGILKNGITLSDVWSDISALPYNAKEKVKHPTQKPIQLIKRIVEIGSNENDLVLDSFAGSCTTAMACIETKRQYICIEKDKTYIDISINRLKEKYK